MTTPPVTSPVAAAPAATGTRGVRAACIMLASGWSANQFSALLGAYRSHLGLTESTVTGLFAVYVVGLIPALLIAGPLADRRGRRRVALVALALNVLSTLLLMVGGAWGGTWLLLPGSFLTGVSAGALLAAGSAWIKELSDSPRRPGLFVSAGFATGGLVAALIAQWAPWPMVTAYVPHVVLGAAAGWLALAAPETVRPVPVHGSEASPAHGHLGPPGRRGRHGDRRRRRRDGERAPRPPRRDCSRRGLRTGPHLWPHPDRGPRPGPPTRPLDGPVLDSGVPRHVHPVRPHTPWPRHDNAGAAGGRHAARPRPRRVRFVPGQTAGATPYARADAVWPGVVLADDQVIGQVTVGGILPQPHLRRGSSESPPISR
ncbi:MFS transporter [Streptomyces sp. NPDC094048]|uniref:MFS transporter n=1 Tax=unclassified Streptomyces TaxID=2593676 RepID=UPI003329BA9E